MLGLDLIYVADVVFLVYGSFLLNDFIAFLRRGKTRLPPGPVPLPVIGNMLDMPKGHQGEFWGKHKELYGWFSSVYHLLVDTYRKQGPISSLSAMGQTIVILNDMKICIELLEKRSAIYSDRPRMVFLVDLYVYSIS